MCFHSFIACVKLLSFIWFIVFLAYMQLKFDIYLFSSSYSLSLCLSPWQVSTTMNIKKKYFDRNFFLLLLVICILFLFKVSTFYFVTYWMLRDTIFFFFNRCKSFTIVKLIGSLRWSSLFIENFRPEASLSTLLPILIIQGIYCELLKLTLSFNSFCNYS